MGLLKAWCMTFSIFTTLRENNGCGDAVCVWESEKEKIKKSMNHRNFVSSEWKKQIIIVVECRYPFGLWLSVTIHAHSCLFVTLFCRDDDYEYVVRVVLRWNRNRWKWNDDTFHILLFHLFMIVSFVALRATYGVDGWFRLCVRICPRFGFVCVCDTNKWECLFRNMNIEQTRCSRIYNFWHGLTLYRFVRLLPHVPADDLVLVPLGKRKPQYVLHESIKPINNSVPFSSNINNPFTDFFYAFPIDFD